MYAIRSYYVFETKQESAHNAKGKGFLYTITAGAGYMIYLCLGFPYYSTLNDDDSAVQSAVWLRNGFLG